MTIRIARGGDAPEPAGRAGMSRRGMLAGLAGVGLAGGAGYVPAAVADTAAVSRSLEFDVLRHQAAGDGVTDDTAAIQSAIDAAAAAGGGVVSFPAGTYKVSIRYGTNALTLRANVTLRGAGPNASTIRLANAQGEYLGILTSGQGDAGGARIEDLCVDQNNTNNQLTSTRSLMSGKPRFCVYVTAASAGIAVRRVRFTDQDNVSAISANGTVGNLLVAECVFEYGSSPIDHDHSAIYHHSTTAQSCWVTNNVFTTKGSGSKSARTAIETHGSSQTITGNRISNYRVGINLTGVGHTTGEGIVCAGNSIMDAAIGVQLWSMPYVGGINTSPGLRNVTIRSNTITLDTQGWAPFFVAGLSVAGIRLATATVGIENATIDGNTIVFRNGTYAGSSKTDSGANGIDWYRPVLSATATDTNVRISGNHVENALAAGIRVSCHGRYVTVRDNTVLNTGRGTVAAGGTVLNSYATGISMTGVLTGSRVSDNHIVDNQATHTMDTALWLYPLASGGGRNEAIGNHAEGYRTKLVQTHAQNGGWYVRMSATSFTNPGGRLLVGSEITEWSTGRVHRQTTAPEGATWT
ncbi:glycosyl hydrolase family 28-related protein [Actinophytocola sp.]|uniref:glycosyl hydrolase family 28-related protein n=1 Tax=Actinophytocola sp. TaxID=1872138 RepID=UPI002ED426DD